MVFDKLSNSFKDILTKIRTSDIDKELIESVIKEIQKSLITSDVNVSLVFEITKKIREKVLTTNISGIDKREHLISTIYDEISNALGSGEEFEFKSGQNRIMLIGLYGQGKTTTTAKLGKYFKERGKKVALISCDTFRAAAQEQLKQLSEKNNLKYFVDEKIKEPYKIWKKYESELKDFDLVIIDSAGRDSLNNELTKEIEKLNEVVKPTDTFLVIGAEIGQNAKKQAEAFKEKLNITGIVITRLDGTGKAGGALTASFETKVNVKFIGVGEKINDIERFNSKKFVSRLLGMGDIETLLEKVKIETQNTFDEKKLKERLEAGIFDLTDLYNQTKAMKKMGGFSKILNLVPGMSSLNISDDMLKTQEDKVTKWKYMIDSMTKKEVREPELIGLSRIERITKGSGTKEDDLRDMLKQYKVMKKMMGSLKGGMNMDESEMEGMMKNMNNPQEMMKMAKKMGLGGSLFKNMKKFRR